MKISPAQPSEEGAIRMLLEECRLPVGDIKASYLDHFFVCRNFDRLIGVIGIEPRGAAALLRSLAVRAEMRGRQVGSLLVRRAEEQARSLKINSLYLLTTTAHEFFSRRGYQVIDRSRAPQTIQETEEFASICPSSSVCMVKRLD